MLAVYAARPEPDDPFAALRIGQLPEPAPAPGWVSVHMRAASLNMHDVSTLMGVRMAADRYPMVLGCDGAGVLDDGSEVVVHPCVNDAGWLGPETLDPGRTVLSEFWPGTFAETVTVPASNVAPKPESLSFADGACTGTAWLTAYRMIFVRSGLRPGQSAVVLGRRGSINTAAIDLGTAAGIAMFTLAADGSLLDVEGRSHPRRPVDAVLDAGVDDAEWSHALELLKPGGAVVCAGYRSGATVTGHADGALHRLIFGELRLVGCAMGTRDDLVALLAFLDRTGLRPRIGLRLPLAEADRGIRAMMEHQVTGKIVFSIPS